jgi:deazaflavin-dependent oxidoreductase (nitroreductase family)/steroid delta-isomerase-like uncharacterized protein
MSADQPSPAEPPSSDWVRAFAERYAEAWNSHEVERVLALLDEDVVWDDPAMLAERPLRDRRRIREFIESFFRAFPDAEFGPGPEGAEIYAAGGGGFALPWRVTGTMAGPLEPPGFAPTGRSFEVEGVDLWEFRDGRLSRIRTVYDLLDWSRQIGVLPDPAGPATRLVVPLQRLRAFLSRRTPRRSLGVGVPPNRRVRVGNALMLPWFTLLPPRGFGVLTTTGRRTGRERRRCVRAIYAGERAYLVSISGRHSAWFKNLQANPRVRLRIRDGTFEGVAREITDPEERAEAMAAYCGTVNPGDYGECVIHRRLPPTREKIRRLHELWFKGGVPLVIELGDAGGS